MFDVVRLGRFIKRLRERAWWVMLGPRLRECRIAAGLTQEDLAYASGIRLNAIMRIENGHTLNPYWTTVIAIARVLNADLEYLAGEDANEPAA